MKCTSISIIVYPFSLLRMPNRGFCFYLFWCVQSIWMIWFHFILNVIHLLSFHCTSSDININTGDMFQFCFQISKPFASSLCALRMQWMELAFLVILNDAICIFCPLCMDRLLQPNIEMWTMLPIDVYFFTFTFSRQFTKIWDAVFSVYSHVSIGVNQMACMKNSLPFVFWNDLFIFVISQSVYTCNRLLWT